MAGLNDVKASMKSLKWYEWIMAVIMIAIAALAVYNSLYNLSWLLAHLRNFCS